MSVAQRLPAVDALKAVASQLIVLHHLAFYGPLSEGAHAALPGLVEWLSEYGRMAVQVFLVVGGFLAARALAPEGCLRPARPGPLIAQRYLRLVLPYLVMLVLSLGSAALAREWMNDPMTPDRPDGALLLAHALLLQGVLGMDGLSAGVWYVAIDFQLYALLVAVLWFAGRCFPAASQARAGAVLIGLLAAASLLGFNRDASWDNWAVYFFGAYGLGVFAFWAARAGAPMGGVLLLGAVAVVALALDFRMRIGVALACAALLVFVHRHPSGLGLQKAVDRPWIARLGRISYSLFLIHFPVVLMVNAAFARGAVAGPWLHVGGALLAWGISLAAAAGFHRWVEQPLGRVRWGRRAGG